MLKKKYIDFNCNYKPFPSGGLGYRPYTIIGRGKEDIIVRKGEDGKNIYSFNLANVANDIIEYNNYYEEQGGRELIPLNVVSKVVRVLKKTPAQEIEDETEATLYPKYYDETFKDKIYNVLREKPDDFKPNNLTNYFETKMNELKDQLDELEKNPKKNKNSIDKVGEQIKELRKLINKNSKIKSYVEKDLNQIKKAKDIEDFKEYNIDTLEKYIDESTEEVGAEVKNILTQRNISEEDRLEAYNDMTPYQLTKRRKEVSEIVMDIWNTFKALTPQQRAINLNKTEKAITKQLTELSKCYKGLRIYTFDFNEGRIDFDIPKKEIEGVADIQLYEEAKIRESEKEIKDYESSEGIKLKKSYAISILNEFDVDESEKDEYKELLSFVVDESSEPQKEVYNMANDTNVGRQYLTTLVNKGLIKRKDIPKLLDESGKLLEYSICDYSDEDYNDLATILYDLKKPNFIVSDYFIEEFYSKDLIQKMKDEGISVKDIPKSLLGSQFCQDNLDLTNRRANEMKDYNTINYHKMYNLNIQLMIMYMDKLNQEIKELKKLFGLTNDKNKKIKYITRIKEIKDILSSKKNFELSFYQNNKYFGVAVTCNKLDVDFITDDDNNSYKVNTREHIQLIKKNCQQKFRPVMNSSRKIKKYLFEYKKSNEDVYNFLNTEFNRALGFTNKKSSYLSLDYTIEFKKCLGVYDFTNDELVENGNPLEVYKTTFAHDKRKKVYNSVLYPINKIILKEKE